MHRRKDSRQSLGTKEPPTAPLLPIVATLVALSLATAAPAAADLYRWVDELGITHYTTDPDRVPRSHRAPSIESSKDAEPLEPASPAELDLWAIPGPLPRPTAALEELDLREIPGPCPRAAREPGGGCAAQEESARPGGEPDERTSKSVLEHDRETLKELLSGSAEDRSGWLLDPRLREIAERLRLEADPETVPDED
jgi:hypothetical protein